MKITPLRLIVAALLVASATSATSQTLGSASNYDIFALNGGNIELKDANQLFGQVAISNAAQLDAKNESTNFTGTIFKHTGGTIKDGDDLTPSGGIITSPSTDSAINQANTDIVSYVNYLSGLTATQSFEDKNSSFSYTSTMGVTVLDFDKVDLDKESFTLPRLPLQADETRKTHEVGASVE